MNRKKLIEANHDWELFVGTLSEDEKQGLTGLSEAIAVNRIYFYAETGDALRFDQAVNTLSNRNLYDKDLVPVIYNFYLERGMHQAAYSYIRGAKKFIQDFDGSTPNDIEALYSNAITEGLLQSVKTGMSDLRSIGAKHIPLVTPDIVNDKRLLGEFILGELVHASKVLVDKIQGVKTIPHEDRYNDLLLATLRLRFQIWAWTITDQARKGSSPSGKNAGETDLIIEAGSQTIALFEALILTGKDSTKTQSHVLKPFGYDKKLDRYYMIVYYKGQPDSLEHTWTEYKKEVQASPFTPGFELDVAKGFEDISSKFDDVNHLKIARSIHGSNKVEMYHILIDLS